MAKGRRFSSNRTERLLGTAYTAQGSTVSVTDPSEFREEDVWSTAEDHDMNVYHDGDWESRATHRARNRELEEQHRQLGGLSMAFEDPAGRMMTTATSSSRIVQQHQYHRSQRHHHVATSAPVNVPDWSKILRVNSVESLHDGFDDDGDNEPEMVPPHEYLARSRKMAANSVFEGVGRTLKGRDMSRVRDAVWSQTGFNG
ncbi:protein S40-5-like [Lotus japonicus]|uniref:protein S40-5-like n=1 Tax=Lotus japonicus TaxID=34305 RepID=UPI002587F88A|nr:protein S40-5-like [Lotus japonicus]